MAARWDGAGLIVSQRSTNVVSGQLIGSIVFLAVVSCIALLASWILRVSDTRLGIGGNYFWARVGILIATAVGLSIVWHVVMPQGFARNSMAVASVRANHVRPLLTQLDYEGLESLRVKEETVIVDARPVQAFDSGHIPGAINVPIDSGRSDRTEVLKQISGNPKIVLYCQSDTCPWAEIIAGDLASRGFSSLHLYPGGWKEWRSHVVTPR